MTDTNIDYYRELDAEVDAVEGDGIRARWEFGRALLMERVGKQLPNGRLDEVAEAIAKSRQEIAYRMKFAERFPTEEQVSNAVGNFKSWHQIVKEALGREWTDEEIKLRDRNLAGETVLANLHDHAQLIAWAKDEERYQAIDRSSDWGNPFIIGDDGDRDAVVDKYREHYLPYKPSLLKHLFELEGKVLGCWCTPARCHGDVLVDHLEGCQ